MTQDLTSLAREQLDLWALTNPRDAYDLAEQYKRLKIRVAREDVNEFIELVMRDEQTGNPIIQAPVHQRFQELASRHKRLILWSHIEAGKTSQISVGRTLWLLGRDPSIRIAIVSKTVRQAMKIMRTLTSYIEKPGIIHEVFPHLRPGSRWGGMAFSIQRQTNAKDPSVQAFGTNVSSVLGSRLDHVVMDDVLSYETTLTPGQRQSLWDWYHASLSGRLTEEASVTIVGTAFHPEDLLHRLAENPAWHWERFPILNKEGKSNWPDRWSLQRINDKRIELGPHEFARQMLCIARDDSQARFKREWIELALRRGDGKRQAYALSSIPAGYRTFTGVDLGVRVKQGADLTVLCTIIVHPDETREILCVESGRWAAKEIISRIVDTHQRFGSEIIVENNAAQQYIIDFTKGSTAIPVRPFTTGKNKYHPEYGIESLATEMANSKWVIPANGLTPAHPELQALVTEILYYDPAAHPGDRLMAMWFAREAARQKKPVAKVRRINLLSR